ncbi:ester cyclase [Yeosuana sp. AK3]
MKKLLIFGLAIVLFTSCNQQAKRYTQQSPEIETVKKLLENYNNQVYDTSVFADSSKSFFNASKDEFMSPSETVAMHKQNDALYSTRGFTDEDPEYEMVVTDDGETWVNSWLNWKGTLKSNGKEFQMPVHLTYQFVDGKIVREVALFDPSKILLELQAIEARNAMSVDEKTIVTAIEAAVKAWNTNDKELMYSFMDPNILRNTNGIKTQSGTKEYGEMMDLYHNAFDNFTVTLNNSNTKGNKTFISWTISGTNTGEFMGNPATNKTISVPGFSIWTFNSDGKATQEEAYADNLAIFQQLGYSTPEPPK